MAARAHAHFYVYYRVAADTAATRATIRALLSEVETRTGIAGRLLARCDDPSTWMEVYESVPKAAMFVRELAALVKKHNATTVAVNGERHVERFAAPPPLPRRVKR